LVINKKQSRGTDASVDNTSSMLASEQFSFT